MAFIVQQPERRNLILDGIVGGLNRGIQTGLETALQNRAQQANQARTQSALQPLLDEDPSLDDIMSDPVKLSAYIASLPIPETTKKALIEGVSKSSALASKSLEGQFKIAQEKQEKSAPLLAGLKTINEMENILKKGNLGPGSKISKYLSSSATKDVAKYKRLGKSIIQLASNILIRNRNEFDLLAEGLYDTEALPSELEGVIEGMRDIINNNLEQMGVAAPRERSKQATQRSKDLDVVESSKKKALGALNEDQEAPRIFEKNMQEPSIDSDAVSDTMQIGKLPAQLALGMAESSPLGIGLDTANLLSQSRGAQTVRARRELAKDLEFLAQKKQSVGLTPDEESELKELETIIAQPAREGSYSKTEPFTQTQNLSVQGLAEGATGIDLTPSTAAEKAARWTGLIRNPERLAEAIGSKNAQSIAKAVIPTGKEAFRGASAGAAWQIAETGGFGPLGQLAATIVTDAAAAGLPSAAKSGVRAGKEVLSNPKQFFAKQAAKFTRKDNLDLQKQIIECFRAQGIELDLGSMTDNNFVRAVQTKLGQSGFTGKELEEFKQRLSSQILDQYETLADRMGQIQFEGPFDAGQFAKNITTELRDIDKTTYNRLYDAVDLAIPEKATVNAEKLAKRVDTTLKKLEKGSLKAPDQEATIKALNKLKNDISPSNAGIEAFVEDLMSNKRALNDIIDYEVQGTAKSLLKPVAKEINDTLSDYGNKNKNFNRLYKEANKQFARHAEEYRNDAINNLLKSDNPANTINSLLGSVSGIRQLKQALNKTEEGVRTFEKLKRFKLEDMIGQKLVDSTSQQVRLGTFSKLGQKSKEREILQELFGYDDYQRFLNLQGSAGRLAESAKKFFNSSNTATQAADFGVATGLFYGLTQLVLGNPWPLLMQVGGLVLAKKTAKLLADPEFLQLTEEAILALRLNKPARFNRAMEDLTPILLAANRVGNQEKQND